MDQSQAVRTGVGVVGLGFGARIHVPAFRSLADMGVEVVAIAGSRYERALALSAELGVPAEPEWRSLVERSDVDVVSVAVPPAVQPAIVEYALGLGKAVFCEKPLAIGVKEAMQLVAAGERTDAPALVDFIFRVVESFAVARTVVASGEIGDVTAIRVIWRTSGRLAAPAEVRHWKDQAGAGGGAVASLGAHAFDYVAWLVAPVIEVQATIEGPPGSGDSARIDGRLATGAGLSVSLSVVSPESSHSVEIVGTRGKLRIEKAGSPDHVYGFRLEQIARKGRLVLVDSRYGDGDGRVDAVARLARRLVLASRDGQIRPPTLADGLRAQRVLAAVEESAAAQSGGPVAVQG